ncbi:Dabb family protein [Verrucomicrobiaceae bacterium 227]
MEHHVYFWLKEERQSDAERQVFEAGMTALCQSSNIGSSYWARPAATAERPVTDHSWSYAISLKFACMEDHDRYQDGDPIHDQFIATFKDWWAKVLVMDLA